MVFTVLDLYILKTSGLGTISVSVPKSNMAAKFKMAAFYTEIWCFIKDQEVENLQSGDDIHTKQIYIRRHFNFSHKIQYGRQNSIWLPFSQNCHMLHLNWMKSIKNCIPQMFLPENWSYKYIKLYMQRHVPSRICVNPTHVHVGSWQFKFQNPIWPPNSKWPPHTSYPATFAMYFKW